MGRAGAHDLPALSGLRAAAATAVLALHMDQAFASLDLGWFARPIELGYLGVDLFFLLSGFVLTHVYGAALACVRPRAYATFLAIALPGSIRFTLPCSPSLSSWSGWHGLAKYRSTTLNRGGLSISPGIFF